MAEFPLEIGTIAGYSGKKEQTEVSDIFSIKFLIMEAASHAGIHSIHNVVLWYIHFGLTFEKCVCVLNNTC